MLTSFCVTTIQPHTAASIVTDIIITPRSPEDP
jgi:hypothetical protein